MLVDELQAKRLDKFDISIKTKYLDNGNILERNTDNTINDNIKEGIIIEKDYIKSDIILKKENTFDSRITYSFETNEDEEIICANCGATSKKSNYKQGCPYCKTSYNIDYKNKELGSKNYYDTTVKSKSYLISTFIIDLLTSSIIIFIYIKETSRTFYFFDILKIVVGAILLALILFFIFYYIDAFFVISFVKRKKELQNKRQEKFWSELESINVEKKKFYNNILYELRKYFYSDKNLDIIDFDIIDYLEYRKIEKEKELFVDVTVEIRIVMYLDKKIISNTLEKTYRFVRVEKHLELEDGKNLIICPGCSASININDSKCSYCGHEINYYQEWYLKEEI